MPYNIEILAIKKELYEPIRKACESLNRVQNDFEFALPPNRLKDSAFLEKREAYKSEDLFAWLRNYREKAGGVRPYIILVVDGHLSSNRLKNLFGNSSAAEGLAIFTVNDFDQFVNDIIRFCRYYFVRYAVGFVEPKIKSHLETLKCIFHKKMDKRTIRESLDSGYICEPCFDLLRPKLNPEINDSVNKLLQVVSNQHPFSIILKGGGVKGLALTGALIELEKYFSFDCFAGTSAGAITAVLLGAGYKPARLLTILEEKNFNDFKDASKWQVTKNFFKTIFTKNKGLYPGDEIERWIRELLIQKIEQQSEIRLCDLKPLRTILYASRENEATMTFDSQGERSETRAAFAARCSMSIPYYFTARTVEGEPVFDGGMKNNFPLKAFMEENNQKPFIGLYLRGEEKEPASRLKRFGKKIVGNTIITKLINIGVEGDERKLVDQNSDKIIVINVHTIGTTDFNLDDTKKEFLVLAGRVAALRFIEKNHPDINLSESGLNQLSARLEELKNKLK